ncbi:hypothetical protein [Edaphobacter modestus]|uniref:Uncharacterized protein n=1 Tax=Edaphobacter modestus TaxID=388466 RepID=A0A4Q7YRP9_9BACT|nr:hypothetical protein [Edaphobacter modestus]RZU40190.1 hypothetical protein BDD14_1629 [Edaphobacter modestus]
MSENTKNPAAQNKTDSVGEDVHKYGGYAKKDSSDWLGGPQNGNENPGKSTEGDPMVIGKDGMVIGKGGLGHK